MHYAVILAWDLSQGLSPLIEDGSPIAFLALGDRRSLLQRAIDRVSSAVPTGNLRVAVRPGDLRRAATEIGEAIRVIPCALGGETRCLIEAAEEIAHADRDAAVLVESASHVPLDESRYPASLTAAFGAAESGKLAASHVSERAERPQGSTGPQVWKVGALVARLATLAGEAAGSVDDLLARIRDDRTVRRLEEVDWIRVTDWEAVRRLLEHVDKPWGHERLWALNSHYAGKILFIKAGESLSLQYHETKDETIRIASGRMRFRAGEIGRPLETMILEPGMSYPIRPRLVHQMEALEDCTVIEVSTPQLLDVVRLEDRYGRA
jgi:mannose-6-phosphate isomerase